MLKSDTRMLSTIKRKYNAAKNNVMISLNKGEYILKTGTMHKEHTKFKYCLAK